MGAKQKTVPASKQTSTSKKAPKKLVINKDTVKKSVIPDDAVGDVAGGTAYVTNFSGCQGRCRVV